MNDRIKQIRKFYKLTQTDFANKLGLSQNFITQLETGSKKPSDRTISDICRIFSINENWLRSGEGEMKLELTKNQEIAQFLNDVMAEDDEEFKKNFIEALSNLNEKEWEALASITRKMVDDLIKDSKQ
jgi:transcriptional regulator with XRE-family HTH domain